MPSEASTANASGTCRAQPFRALPPPRPPGRNRPVSLFKSQSVRNISTAAEASFLFWPGCVSTKVTNCWMTSTTCARPGPAAQFSLGGLPGPGVCTEATWTELLGPRCVGGCLRARANGLQHTLQVATRRRLRPGRFGGGDTLTHEHTTVGGTTLRYSSDIPMEIPNHATNRPATSSSPRRPRTTNPPRVFWIQSTCA